jgi:sec-independent protein translocase protein TatA
MPNIGPLEIAVVAVIVLLIFGPRRLPELGKSLGGGMREFKDSITAHYEKGDRDADEPVAKLEAPRTAVAETKASPDSSRTPVG